MAVSGYVVSVYGPMTSDHIKKTVHGIAIGAVKESGLQAGYRRGILNSGQSRLSPRLWRDIDLANSRHEANYDSRPTVGLQNAYWPGRRADDRSGWNRAKRYPI